MSSGVQLDFIAAPAAASRRVGWLLLVVGVMAAAALARHHEMQRDVLDALRDRVARLQQRLVGPGAGSAGAVAAAAQAAQQQRERWATVIGPLTVPWPALFQALESVPPRGVVLQELLPDAQAGRLRLAAQAPNLAAALAYVERLSSSPALTLVHLVQYTPNADGAAGIGFVVEATWQRS